MPNLTREINFIEGFVFDLKELEKCSDDPEASAHLLKFYIDKWEQTKELLLKEKEAGRLPIELKEMQELLTDTTMSKFASIEQCRGFRDGVCACIEIMEAE